MSLELGPATPISIVDEIKRIDSVASTVFSVCMGIALAAVATVFAVESTVVQITAGFVGIGIAFLALGVVPDVVFGQREPDLSDTSLRKYLHRRRRNTQLAIVVLLLLVLAGQVTGLSVLIADVADDSRVGVSAAVGGVLAGLVAAYQDRDELWPPSVRGRP